MTIRGWRRLAQTPEHVHLFVPTLADLPPAVVFLPGFRVLVQSTRWAFHADDGDEREVDGVTFIRST